MIQIPVTPEQLKALSGKATQEGIAITGNEGIIEKMGVKAAWNYADGLLTVNILEKPFFISTAFCEEQIRKALGVA